MKDAITAAFARTPQLLTYLGLAVVAAGLVLITIGWGTTAGVRDVGKQMPYVMSAGVLGIALVIIGATLVAIDARLREAAGRAAQALALCAALDDLHALSVPAGSSTTASTDATGVEQ